MRKLIGGRTALFEAIRQASEEQDAQWCLELAEYWDENEEGADEEQNRQVRECKIQGLRQLAAFETSANGRHYYLVSAYELEK